ncbi:hypothetical protein NFI95_07215 [Acetobacteraceae bacterium KSS8]|uniref:Uncharacterized protein n=1 Tax=Endosaccharibacter trunci TaxID=2812733 RepID=A0ABT1W7X5_9PROT|nr:hypothetical protein [Acetobacteraceae bacterium KSS8]
MQTIDHVSPRAIAPAPERTPPDHRPSRRATHPITVTPIVPRRTRVLSARDIQAAEDGGADDGDTRPS